MKDEKDKIADLDRKIEQMKAKKKEILKKEKEAAKKAREIRIVRIGTEIESICGEITDFESFIEFIDRHKEEIKKTQEGKTEHE